jgi:hypothetical protein
LSSDVGPPWRISGIAGGHDGLQGDAGARCGSGRIRSSRRTLRDFRYGTLKTWATELGFPDAAALLDATLKQEKATDVALTALAKAVVNIEAELIFKSLCITEGPAIPFPVRVVF